MQKKISLQTVNMQNTNLKKNLCQVKISLPKMNNTKNSLMNKFSPQKEKTNSVVASLDLLAILQQFKCSENQLVKESEETPIVNFLQRQQPQLLNHQLSIKTAYSECSSSSQHESSDHSNDDCFFD
jgi:hypothetical protein